MNQSLEDLRLSWERPFVEEFGIRSDRRCDAHAPLFALSVENPPLTGPELIFTMI